MAASPSGIPVPHDLDCILVENISASGTSISFANQNPLDHTPANRLDIVALFDAHVGKIRKSEGVHDRHGGPLKITFFTPDALQKALCMSGYIFAGRPLVVTVSATRSDQQIRNTGKQTDSRRNLYVLGLPFTLTKTEFASLFSRFGTVCHCVILATLDNASRRRGFVVMSSNEEARSAMCALSRTQLNGHTLDISWAVVQRSQGFLDGGDRRLMFDPPSQDPSANESTRDGAQSFAKVTPDVPIAPFSFSQMNHKPLVLSSTPTSTLLVTNLPAFLFSQTTDLHALLIPFGKIQKLEILPASIGQFLDTIRVIVEYSSSSFAREAKETLQGQYYSNHAVAVEYLNSESSSPENQNATAGTVNASNLNPLAPAFVLATSLPFPFLAKPSPYQTGNNPNAFAVHNNTLLGPHYYSLRGSTNKIHANSSTMHFSAGSASNVVDARDCYPPLNSSKFPKSRGPYAFTNLSNVMGIESPFTTRYV